MRILITEKGTILIQELDDIDVASKMNKKRNLSLSQVRERSSFLSTKFKKNSKTLRSNSFEMDKFSNNTTLIKAQNQNSKMIKLRMNKLSFPKNFVHKYEQDTQRTKNIITTSENFLPSIPNQFSLQSSTDSLNMLNKKYSLEEIIPKPTVTSMKKQVVKDKYDRLHFRRVTEDNFRTYYEYKTELEKFQDVIQYPIITPNKLSLIKYLNEKKNLAPVTLKSIVESEPERINRINKMCQILFHDQEQQRILDDIIKDKIKNKQNSERVDFQTKINRMKSEVDGIKGKLDKYKKTISEKERFRDLHNDIVVNYWSKFDYEKLSKKKDRYQKLSSIPEDNKNIADETIK